MSDYRKMLTVYMRHIVEDTGETFVNGFDEWARKYRLFDELTDEEICELNEIGEEVSSE